VSIPPFAPYLDRFGGRKNGLESLDLTNSIQSATLVAYGKVRSFLTDEGRLGGGLTLATKSVAAGKRAFMQAFTVDCLLSHRGGLPVLRPLHRKERILFLRERRGYVYENKGPLWKKWAGSGNVYENKGSYPFRAGMYVKTGMLTRLSQFGAIFI